MLHESICSLRNTQRLLLMPIISSEIVPLADVFLHSPIDPLKAEGKEGRATLRLRGSKQHTNGQYLCRSQRNPLCPNQQLLRTPLAVSMAEWERRSFLRSILLWNYGVLRWFWFHAAVCQFSGTVNEASPGKDPSRQPNFP